jgi:hypothetical protein
MQRSTPFQSLFTIHAGPALANQLALTELVGESSWEADYDTGVIDLGGRQRARFQVIGCQQTSNAWTWPWAHPRPDISPNLLRAATALRDYGQAHHVDEMSRSPVPFHGVDARMISMVSARLSGADAYYATNGSEYQCHLLLYETPVAARRDMPAHRAAAIIRLIASDYDINHRLMVLSFLAQEGFELEDYGSPILARAPDGHMLAISFDHRGRVKDVQVGFPPLERARRLASEEH